MAKEVEQQSRVSYTDFMCMCVCVYTYIIYFCFILFYSKKLHFYFPETDVNHQTSNIGFSTNAKPPSPYAPSAPIIPIHNSKPLFSSAPPQGNIYLYVQTIEHFVKL